MTSKREAWDKLSWAQNPPRFPLQKSLRRIQEFDLKKYNWGKQPSPSLSTVHQTEGVPFVVPPYTLEPRRTKPHG